MDIQKAYFSLFDKIQRLVTPGDEKTEFLFCSLISVARRLFTPTAFQHSGRDRFLSLLNSPVRRILANALDVFIDLDPGAGEGIFEDLIEHRDNRVAANALVKQAKRDFNRKCVRRLRAFLKSDSAYFRASALYALSEITADLKSRDEVAYNTNENLRALLDLAATVARDSNPMVQRQALRLADKTGRSILARTA